MQRSTTSFEAPPISYDSARTRFQAMVELQELWRYRSLVRNLITRDLKVRYKRSALGFLWVTLNPLLTTLVLSIVFSFLFSANQPHFPVFVLCGIIVWSLFSQGTISAMSNVVGNSGTLRRMYIPPSVFVVSAIGSALVNLLFTIGPLFVIALAFGAPIRWTWLYVPVACVQIAIFTLGVGLVISTLTVFFNDVYEIYLVFLTALNYLTPVFYPISILPHWLRPWEQYNPLYLFISAAQQAVVGTTVTVHGHVIIVPPLLPGWKTQLVTWAVAFLMFTIGWLLFTRTESKFAYHI